MSFRFIFEMTQVALTLNHIDAVGARLYQLTRTIARTRNDDSLSRPGVGVAGRILEPDFSEIEWMHDHCHFRLVAEAGTEEVSRGAHEGYYLEHG